VSCQCKTKQVNGTFYYDSIHRVNNDWWGALEECDMKNFLLLLMVTLNIHHGPQESDAHYNTMQVVLRQHYSTSSSKLSPLFQADVQRIHNELSPMLDPIEGESPEQTMWRFAAERNECRKKGYKVKKA